jgi:hypothetical protein
MFEKGLNYIENNNCQEAKNCFFSSGQLFEKITAIENEILKTK